MAIGRIEMTGLVRLNIAEGEKCSNKGSGFRSWVSVTRLVNTNVMMYEIKTNRK